jgi:Rps23 Pro-64 3,4-dihydroxylase Tpa1-like proline 4-hydroxylase
LENKRVEQVLPRCRGRGDRVRQEVAQTLYAHVSKYKNHKRKERKKSN